ncbi:hypothetical protein PsorP6_007546 [Peronosclerospora sorghi]|uniref:Uncharacterized protein n=1 Tax=Peronosclerospora sorghi TaxID=230839 RepID=A0ACC0WDZ7_9STRA|nr:hypothetical protein PsorP6_007546 [Peronosclerospora sorghi]
MKCCTSSCADGTQSYHQLRSHQAYESLCMLLLLLLHIVSVLDLILFCARTASSSRELDGTYPISLR